ncbi:UNVERIFIED_CONTAM: hypothetical protein GTU68_033780 [Idotea baltica]|nr:hypothetical protein [Idotea baltica]
MIAAIWGTSTLISAAPLMGWKDTDWHGRVHRHKVCLVSQDLYYQVFATMTSFYLPLGVILILYWRIYQAARKRIRRKPASSPSVRRRPSQESRPTTSLRRSPRTGPLRRPPKTSAPMRPCDSRWPLCPSTLWPYSDPAPPESVKWTHGENAKRQRPWQ